MNFWTKCWLQPEAIEDTLEDEIELLSKERIRALTRLESARAEVARLDSTLKVLCDEYDKLTGTPTNETTKTSND